MGKSLLTWNMMVQGVHEETTRVHNGPIAYRIAPYARVQKSVNTFGGSGESIIRCVKRMPIVPSAGSVYADVPRPPSQPNRPGVRKISFR